MKVGSIVKLRDSRGQPVTVNGILVRIVEAKWGVIYFGAKKVIYPLDTLEVIHEGR